MNDKHVKNLSFSILASFCIGVSISQVISLIISYLIGAGEFYPVNPLVIENFGNELNATMAQTLLSGGLGVAFGFANLVWKLENWSLLKRSIVHFLIGLFAISSVAYFMGWAGGSVYNIALFLLIFILIYAIIWLASWFYTAHNIKKMNESLQK